jgi:protein-disulfide isomerase
MASRRDQKDRLRAERLRKEAEAQAQQRRRRLVQLAGASTFVAICIVAVLVVVSQSGDDASAGSGNQGAGSIERQLNGIQQRGTVLGDPKAKTTVVEYGDLQCPVCKEFSLAVAPGLISDLVRKGAVNYEFRQFTIIGADSSKAAKAALAAGEQGRYWNFVEVFYRNQGAENSGYVTDSFLESVARGAGVPNIDKWNADRRSSRWDDTLAKVQADAEALGIDATPSIVVKGPSGTKLVGSGVVPLGAIRSAVGSVD